MFEGYDQKNIVRDGATPLYFQYRCTRYFIEGAKKSDFSNFLTNVDNNCVLVDTIKNSEVEGMNDIEKYLLDNVLNSPEGEGVVMDTIIFERQDESDKTGRTYIKDTLGILYQTVEGYYNDDENIIKFEYNDDYKIVKIEISRENKEEDPDYELYTVDPIFEEAGRGKLEKGLIDYDIEDTMSEEEMIRYANEFAEYRVSDFLKDNGYKVDDDWYHYRLMGDENIIAEKDGKPCYIFIGCSVYPEKPELNPIRDLRMNPEMRKDPGFSFMFLGVQFSSMDPERKKEGVAIRRDTFKCEYTLETVRNG